MEILINKIIANVDLIIPATVFIAAFILICIEHMDD